MVLMYSTATIALSRFLYELAHHHFHILENFGVLVLFRILCSPLIQDGLLAIFVTRSKWCVCIYSKVYTVQYIQYIQYIRCACAPDEAVLK
jgi:hypothetical protein